LSKIDQNSASLVDAIYRPYLDIDPSFLELSVTNTLNSFNFFSFTNIENEPKISINIYVMETNQPEAVYNLNVPFSSTPEAIIIQVIKSKLKTLGQTNEQIKEIVKKYKDSYFLNVCGCDEIIYGNEHKINTYKYVKNCISNSKTPSFNLISTEKLKSKLPKTDSKVLLSQIDNKLDEQQNSLYSMIQARLKSSGDLSWNSKEKFSFYLDSVSHLPMIKDCDKLFFKIAIYHGQELVTNILNTERIDYEKIGREAYLRINQNINLDINVKNLHRCAKLCICLYSISKKKRDEFVSIACITLNLFDYKGVLVNG